MPASLSENQKSQLRQMGEEMSRFRPRYRKSSKGQSATKNRSTTAANATATVEASSIPLSAIESTLASFHLVASVSALQKLKRTYNSNSTTPAGLSSSSSSSTHDLLSIPVEDLIDWIENSTAVTDVGTESDQLRYFKPAARNREEEKENTSLVENTQGEAATHDDEEQQQQQCLVDTQQLRDLLLQIGEGMSLDEANRLVRIAPCDKDGLVDIHLFLNSLLEAPPAATASTVSVAVAAPSPGSSGDQRQDRKETFEEEEIAENNTQAQDQSPSENTEETKKNPTAEDDESDNKYEDDDDYHSGDENEETLAPPESNVSQAGVKETEHRDDEQESQKLAAEAERREEIYKEQEESILKMQSIARGTAGSRETNSRKSDRDSKRRAEAEEEEKRKEQQQQREEMNRKQRDELLASEEKNRSDITDEEAAATGAVSSTKKTEIQAIEEKVKEEEDARRRQAEADDKEENEKSIAEENPTIIHPSKSMHVSTLGRSGAGLQEQQEEGDISNTSSQAGITMENSTTVDMDHLKAFMASEQGSRRSSTKSGGGVEDTSYHPPASEQRKASSPTTATTEAEETAMKKTDSTITKHSNLFQELMLLCQMVLILKTKVKQLPPEKVSKIIQELVLLWLDKRGESVGGLVADTDSDKPETLKQKFQELLARSTMKMNPQNFEKLHELMVMGNKLLVFGCRHPWELLECSLNLLEGLMRDVLPQSNAAFMVLDLLRGAMAEAIVPSSPDVKITMGKMMDVRHVILNYGLDKKSKVIIFMQSKMQTSTGNPVGPRGGYMPTLPPVILPLGRIRYFNSEGQVEKEEIVAHPDAKIVKPTPKPTSPFERDHRTTVLGAKNIYEPPQQPPQQQGQQQQQPKK